MTTGFPGSPRLQRGSLIAIDQDKNSRTTIEFQYNPDTLTRRLTAQRVTGNEASGERSDVQLLKGPPQETISLEIELDATDQLEIGDSIATSMGIYPALSALEVLLYPDYDHVAKNEKSAQRGLLELEPFQAPLTLFVWGQKRTVPVRLTSFSITEESFDPNLNPIRAKASLELQVLTYYDLGFESEGGKTFISYHQNLAQRAKQYKSGRNRT
ncbi:MAG: hypothetical protein M3Z24_10475 [Chloroflexota bacterium]|nr:hypothetical protein [Chloroflexota bacterium]